MGLRIEQLTTEIHPMNTEPTSPMVNFAFLIEQLKAKPFVPFALTLVTGERCHILTKEHLSLPPLDETNKRPDFVVIYHASTSLPRYLALDSIISLDHEPK